jgi:molybdopterin-guanine dinucleotide biosynthesis protein A
MDLYILCSGNGQRFQKQGFIKPKPMLELSGRTFLDIAYRSMLEYSNWEKIYVTVQRKHVLEFQIDVFVREIIPTANIIVFDQPTRGPLESIYEALLVTKRTSSFTVADCDQALQGTNSLKSQDQNLADFDALVPIFQSSSPNHSYAVIADNEIHEIQEKNPISSNAIAGAYTFINPNNFLSLSRGVLQNSRTEPYISHLLQKMIEQGKILKPNYLDWNVPFGTPHEAEGALNNPIFIEWLKK